MRQGRRAALAGIAAAGLMLLPLRAATAQEPGADAVAGFESAGGLLRKCRENSTYARSFCFTYLAAVADAARSYRIWIGSGDPCLPAGLTMGRLADTYEAYLVANPSQTKAQAASVIVASLQEAFPCPVLPAPLPGTLQLPPQQSAPQQIDAAPQDDRKP